MGAKPRMPKRPRQHQLEDASRNALRGLLPSAWVFRDNPQDYGIDGEVEIFDDNGNATGNLFLVQIKATDASLPKNALSFPLKVEACRYYLSLDLPVLIVRYHASSNAFYAKWFETFELPSWEKAKRQKTITFKMPEEDRITAKYMSDLPSNLEVLKQVKFPNIHLPIPFELRISEPKMFGQTAAELSSKIRKEAGKVPEVLRIGLRKYDQVKLLISVHKNRTVVRLAGIPIYMLEMSKKYKKKEVHEKFPSDVLVCVAVGLYFRSHFMPASKIFSEFSLQSNIIKEAEVAVHCVVCMTRAGLIEEALKIAEYLHSIEGAELSALSQYLMSLIYCSENVGESGVLKKYLGRQIEYAKSSGQSHRLATAYYNFGNHIRGKEKDIEAFRSYRLASKTDNQYLKRPYFWKEVGGILFESGHYKWASESYSRALKLGEVGECHALYADSLMYAGQYERAVAELDKYLKSEKSPPAVWCLKGFAFKKVSEILKLKTQKRNKQKAKECIYFEKNENDSDVKDKCEEVLRFHDSLNAPAYFNLGLIASRENELAKSFLCFLMAALLNVSDVESWCNTILAGFPIDIGIPEHFLIRVIQVAYQKNSERFMEQLIENVNQQSGDFQKDEFLNLMNEVISSIPGEKYPVKMRLLGADGEFATLYSGDRDLIERAGT
ncbi:MAG: DUF4365 domain-containing protein [bacterium]|nr:DUF4365 domain-containing protein [bacterium]